MTHDELKKLVGSWVRFGFYPSGASKAFLIGFDQNNDPVISHENMAGGWTTRAVDRPSILGPWVEPKRHTGSFWVGFNAQGPSCLSLHKDYLEQNGYKPILKFDYDFEEGEGL